MAKKNFIDEGYGTYGNQQVGNIAELDTQLFAPPSYEVPYFTKSPYVPYQPPYQAPYQPVPVFTKAPYQAPAPYQPPMYSPAYPVSSPVYGGKLPAPEYTQTPQFGIDYGQPVYVAPAQPVYVAPPYQPPMYSPAYPVSAPVYGGKLPTPEYTQTPQFGYQPVFSPVEPAPVYTAPVEPVQQPVYVAPTPEPVYVEPAPVYTAPVEPVYEQQPVYVTPTPEAPVYVEPAPVYSAPVDEFIYQPAPPTISAPVFTDETPTPAPSVPTENVFVDEIVVPVAPAPSTDSTFKDDASSTTNVIVTPSAPSASSNTLPVSKNLKPYVYAGLGIVVILIVARMVTKKD